MGPFAGPELIAAVSNAGGLGSIGAGMRSPEDLRHQLARTRELTQTNRICSTSSCGPRKTSTP
jgi:NAD(P)H-dependent flavin oxidoreductase YrpB (nitropropane dioxygenase family)